RAPIRSLPAPHRPSRRVSMYQLDNARIMVFGGGGALGRAVVARLRAEGAALTVVGARLPDGRDPDIAPVALDLLGEHAAGAARAGAAPAAVVNLIGGYTPPQPVAALDLGTLRGQIDLNLLTAATVTKHSLPALAASGG